MSREESRSWDEKTVDYGYWVRLDGVERHENVAPSTESTATEVKREAAFFLCCICQTLRNVQVLDSLCEPSS